MRVLAAISLALVVNVAPASAVEHEGRRPPVRRPSREVVVRNKRAPPPDRVRAREAPRDASPTPTEVVKAAPRPSAEW